MTAVEALASGKPVIALGHGGALETVPAFGGVFYDEPSDTGLAAAIERFEMLEPRISAAELREHARRFSKEEFLRKMRGVLGVRQICGDHAAKRVDQ